MPLQTRDTWLDEFVTSAAAERAGTSNAFHRAVRAGRFVTLVRGVHLPAHIWERLEVDDRMRARIHAVAIAAREPVVFSHLSAAAIWRLPMVGTWPSKVEVVRTPKGGGHSREAYTVHTATHPFAIEHIDRVQVTTLARTVADVARTALLGSAVAIADAALCGRPGFPHGGAAIREELERELLHGPRVGSARLRRVLELADGASGSPGESVSRVAMHLEGLPRPVLQQAFRDRRGLIGIVDFWWPEFALIGEFDGRGKYTRDDMLKGMTPAEAVLAEKAREDRLRAVGPRVVRWDWPYAISPPRLARRLRDAGLR